MLLRKRGKKMTNDFKRLAGQLAMGINFDENAVVMATRISDRANKKLRQMFILTVKQNIYAH